MGRDFSPLAELEELRDLVRALRAGEVDGLVVDLGDGGEVLTLSGADRPYRLFVEGMAQGAATVSQDGIILSANPRLAALLATSQEELVGGPVASLLAPGDEASLGRLLTPMPAAELRLTLRTRDERLVPVTVTSNLLDLDDERVVCLIVSDETDRGRAAEQLASSERLRTPPAGWRAAAKRTTVLRGRRLDPAVPVREVGASAARVWAARHRSGGSSRPARRRGRRSEHRER